MRKEAILITGANGEVGHGLITKLAQNSDQLILAVDLQPIDKDLEPLVHKSVVGNVLDKELFARLISEYAITAIYHLAALLSTRAEYTPETAHKVNVEGTINLLQLAIEQSHWQGRPVKFLFPSSIATYGLPGKEAKAKAGMVSETQYNMPTTMYGCTKLYCEMLGRYYNRHYRQLAADPEQHGVDFRCIRFPGLISAVTVPSGGTSDFAPEMLHAAAQNIPYSCFVRPDTRIPFMAMPDAVTALLKLAAAPKENLSQIAYNIGAFAPSASEIHEIIQKTYPEAEITFEPDAKRQQIVDTWPEDVDDSAARKDWGWEPNYDMNKAFYEYLIPTIAERYQTPPKKC